MGKKNKNNKNKNFVSLGGGSYMYNYSSYQTKKENVYVGNKNKSDFPFLIDLLKKTQLEMKLYLRRKLEYYYNKENIICGDGYIYVRGNNPICLTSHMDTTPNVGGKKRMPVIDFYENVQTDKDGNTTHTLTSPQGIGGDDRCGIWSILTILEETKFRPYIVFCEDEEIGCIGSDKFAKTELCKELSNCKFLVEIDRRGNNDCVFYDDDNQEFHKWIEDVTGYKEAIGSCSDICNLSSACGVSSVNLSSGYYSEHTLEEKIIVEETIHTKDVVIKLIEEGCKEEVEQFEYVEYKYYSKHWNNYYNRYYGYEDDYYGWGNYGWGNNYNNYNNYKTKIESKKQNTTTSNIELGFRGYFVYVDAQGEENEVYVDSDSKLGCIAKFMMDYVDVCWADVLDHYFEELTQEENV